MINMKPQYYLGMMSGTSLDGVDIGLVDFSQDPQLILSDFFPMPEDLREKLTTLVQAGETTLQNLGELDHKLALLYSDCVNAFLQKNALLPNQIQAIGCHGQTVWHSPNSQFPFTMQLGDMNLLAAKTGISVIGDFRRKDMAWGGQGAPLVPAFHEAVFSNSNFATAVLNIGGISNVSILFPNQAVIGFDMGPGNTLLDQWIEKHQGLRYDENGKWAAKGNVNKVLLDELLNEPFFSLPAPKSTGRELFNLDWLNQKIAKTREKLTALSVEMSLRPEDVQATLVELTVTSIVNALNQPQTDLPKRLLVCGGGAKNSLIMCGLHDNLLDWQVGTTTEQGFDIDYVEAAAFAWLAYCRMNNLPANLPSVTGAKSAVSLGAIFPKD
ncbi:TPA: anhydro-N-acetylmuramic acid kinase [Haemophilus influenzae]|uniref:anhydro-N-acetylmuramic acid kinase n=1 Tax=Haemophilus TaxID=724 RepID=UPI000392BA1F|nr:anhydro-N-acetylmuramic acid kinase [Haemophilus influenzae]AGV11245.1 anhydro-N-acetylmuramic acid kinase [Haemophilus influenzae KR494]MCK8819992.1 anhydro-N-acetylmuramic acid kinase [Haemophilus influenzae]MCK8880843.1 anhydro-N-acetylmuramic acid kinase [Haemophilus influenzae]MDF3118517.1 anhydro-N-acetylmuramic acid kinase [Haemophilus influenzae]OXS18763.1 anhydro-N-acetylmuramic acid kinase [Haemophilus influenzae]